MYFFIELAKIIKSIPDKQFSQYYASFPLFLEHNKTLGKKWTEYLEKNKIQKTDEIRKEWQQTIREIRNWEDQELDYMYQKIMAMSRQILGKNVQYFTVETFSGQLTIPDRIQILNRLITLSNELLTKIYPSIMRLLNYKINDEEIISSNIRGTINWNKTIQHALKTSGGELISFVSSLPTRSFQTPENILLLLSIKLLHDDAKQIMDFQNKEYVSPEDKEIIWDVANRTKKILTDPFLSEISKNTKTIKVIVDSPTEIKRILKYVEKNLQLQKTTQKEYYNLLGWTKKYIDFNVNRYQNLSNFTLENIKDIDTMFELWILFEFVTYFKKIHRAKIHPITETKKGEIKLRGFEIEIKENKFNLMYDHEYKKIPIGSGGFEHEENKIKPDFTFEFGENCLCGHKQSEHHKKKKQFNQCEWNKGQKDYDVGCRCDQFRKHIPLVLDAKNWKNENRIDAVRVMTWYLMNMNKYKTKTGILLFSNYKPNQDPTVPLTDYWGPVKINEGEWEFLNFVVKSSNKPVFKEQLEQVFKGIVDKFPFEVG